MRIYPVGATWEYVAPTGKSMFAGAIGRVWLEARHENGREHWRWSWAYGDGSDARGDWTPTRQSAVDECRLNFEGQFKVRFRRVQETAAEEQ